jgi:hypothetical protein
LVFQTLEQPSLLLSIEKDGDGSGDVFSSPAGIDCGDTCTGEFLNGTEITLTATFEPQPPIDRYLLAVVRAGTGSGHVISDSGTIDCGAVCTAEYGAGTSDTLRATAAAGSVFEPLPKPHTFPLFISKIGTGAGRVTSKSGAIDCGPTCRAELAKGTSVTLSATPDPNSTFMGWQGGGCTGVDACTVTLTQAQSITARLDRNSIPKTLTVQKRGTGRGTVTSDPEGINCGVECGVEFADNAVVTLTVEPASDSTFVGWVGGLCSGTVPSCRLTMNDNRLIQALINSEEPPSGADGPSDL